MNKLITILVITACAYYLVVQYNDKVFQFDSDYLMEQLVHNWVYLLLAACLLPFNWGIEVVKWKVLIQEFQDSSWTSMVKSVFSGVALAIATPNGIGDYAGRLNGIKQENFTKALASQFISSTSQLIATLGFGAFGWWFLQPTIKLIFWQDWYWLMSVVAMLLCLGFFFSFKLDWKIIPRSIRNGKLGNDFVITRKMKLKLLNLSLIRYCVFATQFCLIAIVFGIDVSLFTLFTAVAVVYLLATLIPTGWLSSLLVRGSVAFFVFNQIQLGYGEKAILASSVLWCLNLLFPALLGLYYIRNVTWLKSKIVQSK